MRSTLTDQVAQAANLLGLLLALATLFTSEQARRLADERQRPGGAQSSKLATIRATSIGLGLVTAGSLALLGPLVIDVGKAIGGPAWQPVLGVFALVYLLLGALLAWQIVLACRSG